MSWKVSELVPRLSHSTGLVIVNGPFPPWMLRLIFVALPSATVGGLAKSLTASLPVSMTVTRVVAVAL